jgi:hypothetical protein
MTREHFRQLVEKATIRTREYAKEFVTDNLPDEACYSLNISSHYPNLKPTELTYPEMSMETNEFLGPITAGELIENTWIEGRVPVWIDLSPSRRDSDFTYFDTFACNRFSSDEKDLYCTEPGIGPTPFGQKSPKFPPGWSTGCDKFSLRENVERFQHLRRERGESGRSD